MGEWTDELENTEHVDNCFGHEDGHSTSVCPCELRNGPRLGVTRFNWQDYFDSYGIMDDPDEYAIGLGGGGGGGTGSPKHENNLIGKEPTLNPATSKNILNGNKQGVRSDVDKSFVPTTPVIPPPYTKPAKLGNNLAKAAGNAAKPVAAIITVFLTPQTLQAPGQMPNIPFEWDIPEIKIHYVYKEGPYATPYIWQNTVNALDEDGQPRVLIYHKDKDLNQSNRDAAQYPLKSHGVPDYLYGLNGIYTWEVDEFPYACTLQGGLGATIMWVPAREQRRQGGLLRKLNLQPGDWFIVVPIPRR